MFSSNIIADGVSLDLRDDLPISINSSIAEIQEPEKRMGTFSKTIVLLGTKTNNDFFEHRFDVNVALQTFNPNAKIPCQLLIDEIDVLKDAFLKLNNIEIIINNDIESINYEVLIYSSNSDLFTSIGDKYLHELDFSEHNHTLSRANAIASWGTAVGTGYKYPLIDYGYKQFNDYYFHIEHLRPALSVYEYLVKIFQNAGKTFTSSILNSDFVKRLYIPHNGDGFNMSLTTLNNYQFYAGRLSVSASTNYSISYKSFYSAWQNDLSYALISSLYGHLPNDDSTSPFNDAGNRYNTSTGVFTVGKNGWYQIKGQIKDEIKFNLPAGAVTVNGGVNAWVYLIKSTNGGSTWTLEGANYYQSVATASTSYQSINIDFSWNLGAAGTNWFAVGVVYIGTGQSGGVSFLDGGSSPVTTGSASFDVRHRVGGWTQALLTQTNLLDGDQVVMNDCIPRDYKQRDFFLSICKMLNLYVDIDKSNTNNYIIETRNDFYNSGTSLDWTDKLAIDSPFIISPMGALNTKVYKWQYKSDKDYYNEDYEKRYLEPYGSKTKVITNDFLKNEQKTEVIFSPTIIVDNAYNKMVVPKIISYDNVNVKPLKHNIRILYYGGLKSSGNTWDFTDNSGALAQTQYPFFGMVDDPINDTLSIEFGIPAKIYYSDPTLQYTDNNLYNRFYYQQISEIIDIDSMIVTCYCYLSPVDILNFDFRNKVFINGVYYLVNKIIDYNPLKKGLTKLELLKLKSIPPFEPEQKSPYAVNPNVGVGYTDGVGMSTGNNLGNTNSSVGFGNNLIAGDNIQLSSEGVIATGSAISVGKTSTNINVISSHGVSVGDNVSGLTATMVENCFIGNECYNIKLDNCHNIIIEGGAIEISLSNCYDLTIESNVVGFSASNLNNMTITSDYNYRNIVYDSAEYLLPTNDFNITLAKMKYCVDGSALPSNVQAQLPSPQLGMRFFIKNIGSSNGVDINSTVGILIDGASTYTLTSQFDSVWLEFNGSDWVIL